MAKSKVIDELLYRYPIQLNDVKDIKLGDWKYRAMGQARWALFKVSIFVLALGNPGCSVDINCGVRVDPGA